MIPRTPRDSHAYIPPSVQKSMQQHMERSLPAHLKKYQNSGTMMPQHAQDAIAQHMQKVVPGHMKQYVDPYIHQHVVFPGSAPVSALSGAVPHTAVHTPVPHPAVRPPVVDLQQLNQATPAPVQPTYAQQPLAPAPASQPQVTNGPQESYAAASAPTVSEQPAYDFITNPGQTPKSARPKLSGGMNPLVVRIALVMGGLVVLLILFNLLKGVLSSSSNNKPLLISAVQHQQELIHLATNAGLEPSLSTHNKNFAITAQLSLTSARSDLITYLGQIGVKKVSPKVLNLKVDPKTDEELEAAATADTYNPTFQRIMKTQLDQYQLALQTAYSKTAGPKGRELLTKQFKQSQLLQQQLSETAETP